jgi:linoleoyl-CoA desaturase
MKDVEKSTGLYTELKQRANLYFEETGKKRVANRVFWIKMVLFAVVTIAGYVMLFRIGKESLFVAFACYLVFTMGSTLFVVTVGHDASHQAILKSRKWNTLLSYAWNLIGMSKYLWEIKHHHSHHIHTNIPHQDVDISESALLRFSTAYPYRSYYRYQHLYAPLLYLLFGSFIVYVRDFTMALSDKLQPYGSDRLPHSFLVRLVVTKMAYLTVNLIVPVLILPFAWWQVVVIHLISQAICGGSMLLVLVVPHLNRDAALRTNKITIRNQHEWTLHQIHSTVDSSGDSHLLNWLTGGLNTHLVHHLFPNICHIHYPPLTRVIKEGLLEQGIPYLEKSFIKSIVDHFKYLRLMGTDPKVGQS